MPRTARASPGDICYHVINRGNARARVFHDDQDYLRFHGQFIHARNKIAMRLAAWCIMPNHFHFVLWPRHDGDLSRFMHCWINAHIQAHRKRYGTVGHIWQGRFKAFPIQHDAHLFSVLRYVERNPLRARLVRRAEEWPWSSLPVSGPGLPLSTPVERPMDWIDRVNQPQSELELAALRESVNRERPYGQETWAKATACVLGLESSLHPKGRPPKSKKASG